MEHFFDQNWQGGLSAAIIYGIVWLITSWINSRSENKKLKLQKTETENQTVQVLTASLQSALASIQALQQQSDTQQAERLKANDDRIKQQNEIDRLQDEIRKVRAEAETANMQLADELVKVRGELAAAKNRISDLERQNESKDTRIREQDQKMALLKGELERSEKARADQQCELEKLTERLNGKADKPITDEIPDVTTDEPTPGESAAPVVNETREEN